MGTELLEFADGLVLLRMSGAVMRDEIAAMPREQGHHDGRDCEGRSTWSFVVREVL